MATIEFFVKAFLYATLVNGFALIGAIAIHWAVHVGLKLKGAASTVGVFLALFAAVITFYYSLLSYLHLVALVDQLNALLFALSVAVVFAVPLSWVLRRLNE